MSFLMIKTLAQLTDYDIHYLPQEDYSYLTTLDIAAIAIKYNNYVQELLVTTEDYLECSNYKELQLKSKYYLVYKHDNSNLSLRFKVNNTVANEKFSTYQYRYTKHLIKLTIFLSLLLNYVQENLRR